MFMGEKDKFNVLNDPGLFKSNHPNAHLVMDFNKQMERGLLPNAKKNINNNA
jgi:hypothetical protein